MPIVISEKNWGNALIKKDGKVKAGARKPRDASMARQWNKSTKQTAISPAKAKGLQR